MGWLRLCYDQSSPALEHRPCLRRGYSQDTNNKRFCVFVVSCINLKKRMESNDVRVFLYFLVEVVESCRRQFYCNEKLPIATIIMAIDGFSRPQYHCSSLWTPEFLNLSDLSSACIFIDLRPEGWSSRSNVLPLSLLLYYPNYLSTMARRRYHKNIHFD